MTMYLHATDNGVPTVLYSMPNSGSDGKDLRLLPLMLRAAEAAEENEFCDQYDRIADAIGTWTRDELREAGLLVTNYTVTGEATVTLTLTVPWSYTAEFSSEDAARDADPSDYIDIDMYDLSQQVRNSMRSDDVTVDDWSVDSVERD